MDGLNSQPQQKSSDGHKWLMLLIALVILAMSLVRFYYAANTTNKPPAPNQGGVVTQPPLEVITVVSSPVPTDAMVKISFDYTVKAISPKEITIAGKLGDMVIPTDSDKLTIQVSHTGIGVEVQSPRHPGERPMGSTPEGVSVS